MIFLRGIPAKVRAKVNGIESAELKPHPVVRTYLRSPRERGVFSQTIALLRTLRQTIGEILPVTRSIRTTVLRPTASRTDD